jgi:ABC-type nitrate/sulfonate/bicarbonate transport system substrate-binding protein
MTSPLHVSRRDVLAAGLSAAALASLGRPALGAWPAPEQASIKVGTAVSAMSFLPVYVALAKTWKAQGLDVQLFQFRGDAEISQALVGGSIDICVGSLNGVINMISTGQPVMGFYSGFHQADFSWIAQSNIKRWSDLKGKAIGVATYGSLTDALTRYALRKNKLEPEKDVQIVQAGTTASTYQAIKGGRLAAGILSPPFSWQAQDEGLTLLGTQEKDVSNAWPKHLYSAKTKFIADNPHTVEAVLRGHVAALRLARKDREAAVDVMVDQLKLARPYAERAYDVEMPGYDERGGMPERSMPVFWDITISLGDVTSAWDENKYLDHRFINSFKTWAP